MRPPLSRGQAFASPSGAKAVTVGGEIPFEDRLQHRAQRRLDHPVLHRWYPQRTLLLAPRLGDVVPSDVLRAVGSAAQRFAQARQIGIQIARVLRDRDTPAAPR